VFVHKNIWDQFVPALVARTKAMKIGNPLNEDTTVGATISRQHAEKVLSYISKAKQAVKLISIYLLIFISFLCDQRSAELMG